MLDAVEGHGGVVLQLAGDAISAAFGAASRWRHGGAPGSGGAGGASKWAS